MWCTRIAPLVDRQRRELSENKPSGASARRTIETSGVPRHLTQSRRQFRLAPKSYPPLSLECRAAYTGEIEVSINYPQMKMHRQAATIGAEVSWLAERAPLVEPPDMRVSAVGNSNPSFSRTMHCFYTYTVLSTTKIEHKCKRYVVNGVCRGFRGQRTLVRRTRFAAPSLRGLACGLQDILVYPLSYKTAGPKHEPLRIPLFQ